jgi:hypothetical protein
MIARDSKTENDMNEMILDNRWNPGHARGLRGRTAAWVAGLALVAAAGVNGTSVRAEVYDDFESATRTATLWTSGVILGTGGYAVTNGQVRLYVTPTNPPPNNHAFSSLLSRRTWTLREGRTLEFRVDLRSSNDDGAMVHFGFALGDGNSAYEPVLDEDTFALMKRTAGQYFILTNGVTIKVSNVKLVVSMTGVQSSVLLKFKILDNDNAGAVIFERECWDTAAADPLQLGTDSPPGSYIGQTGYFQLSLFRDANDFDPVVTLPAFAEAEVVCDNAEVIEYYPPHLEIARATNAVALNWMLPMEEHIVVEADQLTGPWCPCPQAYTRTGDVCCLSVPYQSPQKFFKLTPGTQFTDYFTNAVPAWKLTWNQPGSEFLVTNGVLRLNSHGTNTGAYVAQPPGPDVVVSNFCMSVDILDWVTSSTNWSDFGLIARGYFSPTGGGVGYGAGLILNSDGVPGRVTPFLSYGSQGSYGVPFKISEIPPPYRLEYCGIGTRFSLRLVNLTTQQLVREMSATFYGRTTGWVGLWISAPAGVDESQNITVDNFFATGTKP